MEKFLIPKDRLSNITVCDFVNAQLYKNILDDWKNYRFNIYKRLDKNLKFDYIDSVKSKNMYIKKLENEKNEILIINIINYLIKNYTTLSFDLKNELRGIVRVNLAKYKNIKATKIIINYIKSNTEKADEFLELICNTYIRNEDLEFIYSLLDNKNINNYTKLHIIECLSKSKKYTKKLISFFNNLLDSDDTENIHIIQHLYCSLYNNFNSTHISVLKKCLKYERIINSNICILSPSLILKKNYYKKFKSFELTIIINKKKKFIKIPVKKTKIEAIKIISDYLKKDVEDIKRAITLNISYLKYYNMLYVKKFTSITNSKKIHRYILNLQKLRKKQLDSSDLFFWYFNEKEDKFYHILNFDITNK